MKPVSAYGVKEYMICDGVALVRSSEVSMSGKVWKIPTVPFCRGSNFFF